MSERATSRKAVQLAYEPPLAFITLRKTERLNAFAPEDYDAFADALEEIESRTDILVTVWQAQGRFFSAGADVTARGDVEQQRATKSKRRQLATRVVALYDVARLLSEHTKILVAIMNGPAMGVAAAYLGHFDFVYATPGSWIALPFSSLGIVSEMGTSVTFPNRMGSGKATEVLLWGKKATVEELLPTGFVSKIFPPSQGVSPSDPDAVTSDLHQQVHAYLRDLLSSLDPVALLEGKRLIRAGIYEKNNFGALYLRESTANVALGVTGIPERRFGELARKERRHKL